MRGRELSSWWRLVGLLRNYRGTVAVGVVVSLAITVAGLARPWPTKILVDDVLGDEQLGNLSQEAALLVVVGATVGLFLVSGALGLLQTRILFGLSQRLIQDLRARLFDHLTRLSLRYHDANGTGDSLYRVTTDTYAVQSVLLDGLVPLSAAALALVGTLVVMFRLDPVLALLAVVSSPAAAAVSHRYGRRIQSMSLDVHQRESAVYAHAEQTLGGIRTVQAFSRESFESERFRTRADKSRSAMLRLVTEQTLFGLAIDLVLAFGLALVTYVAARRALDGHLSTGEVLVFLAYAGSLYGPVSGLAAVFGELQGASAGAQRVFEVLDSPQVPDRPALATPPPARGEVHFDDVTFAYHDGHTVLRDVSFEVRPGRMVALVGPTGAGKSTIVSLLLRLYDVDGGRVLLDGVDVRDVPLSWLRDQVTLVPQDPILFPVSVRENIRYGRLDASDADVEEAAYEANILAEVRAMPHGFDTPVGDRGVMLSGGQRQRVAIARALLRDAPVVVLDEPTSALDAGTEVLVMEAIDRLVAGRTCLVIAHRLSTVHRADRVLVVDGGQIVQQGTHRMLVRRRGLYRELHDARFGEVA